MLQQICEHIHNYFIKDRHNGTFEIADAAFSLPFLLEGQRFLIEGSALNDGVYTYHIGEIWDDDNTEAVGLQDETWTGTICALAVPPAVIALSGEMKAWVDANGDRVNSPYSSENVIGVYSYTKAQGGSGAGGSITVFDAFRDKLNLWRKVAF